MTQKVLRTTYSPNYFSIDYIMACHTLVPCRTEVNLPKFGFLVPDCQSQDLPQGVELQLPLWAARIMCRPTRKHVSVNIPPGFKESYSIEVLTSEGKRATTDLQKIHPHYYEVGHLCTSLYHEDAGDLAEMLPEVLQQRLMQIGASTMPGTPAPWVQNICSDDPIPVEFMDSLEHQIFQVTDSSSKRLLEWLEPVLGTPSHVKRDTATDLQKTPEVDQNGNGTEKENHTPSTPMLAD